MFVICVVFLRNYLKTLATYPKPLIGGVSGNLMNLGVVQLALFDVVIASDKTTFETPYAKMGQIPEGYCIWHNMNKIRGSFVSYYLDDGHIIEIFKFYVYYRKPNYFGWVKEYNQLKLL